MEIQSLKPVIGQLEPHQDSQREQTWDQSDTCAQGLNGLESRGKMLRPGTEPEQCHADRVT